MSSFFLPAKGSSRDRKRKKIKTDKKKSKVATEKKSKGKPDRLDEEIASDSDEEVIEGKAKGKREFHDLIDSDEEEETAPEKRLRLAKEYLSRLEEEERSDKGGDDVDHDAIAHRLRQDVLEQAGKLHRKVADLYLAPSADTIRFLKGHQLPVTCVAVTPDDKYIYSGSKDCCIIKWNVETGRKEVVFSGHRKGVEGVVGHRGHVMALAVSSDGQFLASGGQDKVVHIWDARSNIHLHTFSGHRDIVSGVAFQRGTHELFSCSFDRTVKIWNLDEMAYVETLFGHQDGISSIDCLSRERPVTGGMNDRTVRLWKVLEESQLVFHGHKASIDCLGMINEEHFVSGSQDGIALWSIMKKKPLIIRPHHPPPETEISSSVVEEHWVTAVATYPSTDLIASGSNDGQICLWKCGETFRALELCFTIPLNGFINSLAFSHSGDFLVAGVGQEHRFGRWWRNRTARNSVAIIPLQKQSKSTV